jgi:hypothetical protein
MGKFILGGISSSQLSTVVLDKKELVYDVDNNQIYYGDGTATGGLPLGITGINASAGTTSNGLTNIVFSNSNGVSFGLNGSTVTASFSGGGGTMSAVNVSAGTTSNNLTALTFNNANGITFGLNASVVTASHNGLTTAMASNQGSSAYFSGNTTAGTSSGSYNGTNVTFLMNGMVSGGMSGNSVVISAPASTIFQQTSQMSNYQSTGAYLTTAAQSNQVVNSLNGSTGQISLNVGSSLSASTNGSSITFGLASNITTALQSAGAYLTTARASTDGVGLNTAQTNVTWTVNSSGISLNASGYAGIGTSATNASITLNSNGLAISVAAPGGGGNVVITAGLANTTLSNFSFGDANGVNFGINGSTITASHNGLTTAMQSDATTTNIRSYFDNGLVYAGTTAFSMGGSSNYVQPFILPYPVSASFIRIANSWAFGSTTGATSANQSLTLNNSQSIWVNIYTKGTGANAKSLQFITSGSVSLVFQVQVSIGAASNNQTIYHNYTYPQREGSAQGNFATNYNLTNASYNVSTTHLTSFNGSRWLDVPFAASLSPGNYWMAIAQSTATATTGGVAAMTNLTARNTYVAVSQINGNIAAMGTASNNSTNPMRNGLGYWSTNANGSSSSSLGLTGISSVANQPVLPFQIIREA